MSNKANVALPDLITQVKRADSVDEYDGGISARREPYEENEDSEYVIKQNRSIFQKIFCCFSHSSENSVVLKSVIEGSQDALLPPQSPEHKGRKCLLLDLDETLVHSSFKPIQTADFIVPVEIENQVHQVYVSKRPGVDNFLKVVGDHFEVVVFTASLSKYADPVLDLLDIHKVVKWRLFRDACTFTKGNYVKDLSRVGRKLTSTLIIDNSPTSFLFHPEYAIEIGSWFDDMNDTELTDMLPFLCDILAKADDVRIPLKKWANGEI